MMSRRLLALSALALLLAAPAAPAQDLSRAAASLKFVPDDVLFYSASLRMREQLEAVMHSKAWARLRDLPAAQMLRQKAEEGLNQPGGPLAKVKEWYEQRDNRQLLRLLGEMFSDEIFCYGGRDAGDLFTLLGDLQNVQRFAPLAALMEGKDPQRAQSPAAQARFILRYLAQNADRIKAPDLVIGFRLRDTKRARAQLRRLDRLVQGLVQQTPQLEGRWSKAKVGGGEFYTLKLDGGLVPWDKVPWQELERRPGELDKLRRKLRELKVSVSVGLRGQFLIVAVGSSRARLKALGQGGRLAEREEFKRLAPFAGRRLTSISYGSKEWQALELGGGTELGGMPGNVLRQLRALPLPAEQRQRIRKDLRALAKDMAAYMPKPGPTLSFTFLTGKGAESYRFRWGERPARAAGGPLPILEHLGGAPLLFTADRQHTDPEEYRLLVKWVKIAYAYVEDYSIPHVPPEARRQFEKFMRGARPLLARLNRATGKMLLPGLGADNETALVIDAKVTSKKWFRAMPAAKQPLPLPAPALVLSVQDAKLLRQAGREYREVLNGLIALTGKTDFRLPPPKVRNVPDGTLYYYPLPGEAGVDKRLAPTAGLGERWLVLSLAPNQAGRLLQPTPLTFNSILLKKHDRPLAVAYVNWAGLVRAATPWVDYALDASGADNAGLDVRGQVHTVLEVLQVVRGYMSVTYVDGGAVVTHGRTAIRDVE
jgi:hypothetical protein